MTKSRKVSRLVSALGAALAVGALAWLLFGVGERHDGMRRLMEAEGARVDAINNGDAALTLDEVIALPAAAWETWKTPGYMSTPHGKVIWVRARLPNRGTEPMQGVLSDTSYFSDRVDAWITNETGGWRHEVSGDAIPGREKPLWGRVAAFPVMVPVGGERLIYLRVSDAYVAHVQPMWWPRAGDFFEAQIRNVLAECVCYGALAALLFYNLVLWARLRFADTGYYVLAAGASAACNVISNNVPALVGWKMGSPWHETLMAVMFAGSSVFMLQFARAFLGTKELLPRLDRVLRGWWVMLVIITLALPAMLWMETPIGVTVSGLVTMTTDGLYMGAAVVAWYQGAKHARFFVAAFALLIVAVVPAMVSLLRGDVASGVAMGLLAGRTAEMLLLSFAVADRFAQTQQQLVEETEQRRAMEEAYADELKTEVRERTRELQQANVDKDRMLTVIGHDLRSPLTGLMRTADANSGELAHEVSRTGRALLLLIEDLVLWARLRAGMRLLAPHPASDLAGPAVALHRALAEHGGIELALDLPEDLHVKADLVLAQTLVRNLLANALKFAETRVRLRAVAEGDGNVRFTVGNDGPPLPPEVAARFAEGKNEPITATGGLGLRLCREICGAMETRLEAGMAADGGTEFSFVLKASTADGR